eukprot:566220-Rhodomonas_salina.6
MGEMTYSAKQPSAFTIPRAARCSGYVQSQRRPQGSSEIRQTRCNQQLPSFGRQVCQRILIPRGAVRARGSSGSPSRP